MSMKRMALACLGFNACAVSAFLIALPLSMSGANAQGNVDPAISADIEAYCTNIADAARDRGKRGRGCGIRSETRNRCGHRATYFQRRRGLESACATAVLRQLGGLRLRQGRCEVTVRSDSPGRCGAHRRTRRATLATARILRTVGRHARHAGLRGNIRMIS